MTCCKRTINVGSKWSLSPGPCACFFSWEGPWLLLTAKALLKCEILEDYTCFTSIMIDIGYGNATSPCLQYHWINCSRWGLVWWSSKGGEWQAPPIFDVLGKASPAEPLSWPRTGLGFPPIISEQKDLCLTMGVGGCSFDASKNLKTFMFWLRISFTIMSNFM